jgi:hypothetical protein
MLKSKRGSLRNDKIEAAIPAQARSVRESANGFTCVSDSPSAHGIHQQPSSAIDLLTGQFKNVAFSHVGDTRRTNIEAYIFLALGLSVSPHDWYATSPLPNHTARTTRFLIYTKLQAEPPTQCPESENFSANAVFAGSDSASPTTVLYHPHNIWQREIVCQIQKALYEDGEAALL